MLIDALTAHFRQQFDRDPARDVVLWFDPRREYEPLLDHLDAFPVWRCDGSLLKLRYRLLHREADARVLVYLPMAEDEADLLRPFFALSHRFEAGLYHFLREQGFDFPEDPEVAQLLRSLLPRLAVRSLGKGEAFWEQNLGNVRVAVETLLGGNFDDALLQFLARPRAVFERLRADRLDQLFLSQLEATYGLRADPDADAPDGIAERLVAQLVLVRAFVGAGAPGDFPYETQLPDPVVFERSQAFLSRWQRDVRYGSVYAQYASALQRAYNLAKWVRALDLETGLGLGPTLPEVEDALWAEVHAAMAALADEGAWQAWLAGHRDAVQSRAGAFWARQGQAPYWGVLDRAARLLTEVREVRAALDTLADPAAILERYAERWWQVDLAYRELRESLSRQSVGFDTLRRRCNRAYRDVLDRMNRRFGEVLGPTWPPDGLPAQTAFWPAVAAQRRGDRPAAVMFVDALRYELGQALVGALNEEGGSADVAIQARLAAIPSITPIGMSAVLPEGDARRVAYDDDWEITIAGSQNLGAKRARQAWLEANLDPAVFCSLAGLLDDPPDDLPDGVWVVVFDTTLDRVGEHGGVLAWDTFSTLLQSVRRGVHTLLNLGVRQVHLIADHGFLLLEDLGEHEKVTVRAVGAQAKGDRYVVGAHLGHTDQLAYPIPGSADLVGWFPRGVGCFRTPGAYNFVHGGLSLQELVVPHITVEAEAMGRPVGIEADLPAALVNAQPEVTLNPVSASVFDTPRSIVLTLARADGEVLAALRKVVAPGAPARETLMLPFDCGLERGDALRWTLRDAHTGETLAAQDAVSRFEML